MYISDNDLRFIISKVRPFSMVPDDGLHFTILSALKAIVSNKNGVFVECGVWKGGSSLAILLAQKLCLGRVIKPVYLLDSFEGLPKAKEIDGELAIRWQNNTESVDYFDNATALIQDVRENLLSHELKENVDFYLVKGWFHETIPDLVKNIQDKGIAMLRLDGDWYESTIVCLENLVPLVSYGATVIIDDYYAWDGCAVAVHEYLGKNKLSYRIRTIGNTSGAYFYTKHRDSVNEI